MLFLNPAFLFASIWLFVIALYALRLSDVLEPLQTATWFLIVGSSASFVIGWLIESATRNGRVASTRRDFTALVPKLHTRRVARRMRSIWIFFALGIAVEIAYFRGAPILTLLGIGNEVLYSEFGLPALHGFLNAVFYAGCSLQFSRILTGPASRRSMWLLATISILYPVIVMSRQVLISLLLEYLIIYVSIRGLSPKILFRVGFVFTAAFLIFGYLGDLRSGRDSIISLAQPTFDYPEWLPSAFIWFYIYLCTPLNNVNFNVDIPPHFFPFETIGSLIPSFARESFLSLAGTRQEWQLVTESFNVSSLLQSLLTDFGVTGTIVFTCLCGIAFSRLLRRSATRPVSFFATVVFLHGIALSFFANLLFHLVFLFQIVVTAWVLRPARARR